MTPLSLPKAFLLASCAKHAAPSCRLPAAAGRRASACPASSSYLALQQGAALVRNLSLFLSNPPDAATCSADDSKRFKDYVKVGGPPPPAARGSLSPLRRLTALALLLG
jgi:hypothetical protein